MQPQSRTWSLVAAVSIVALVVAVFGGIILRGDGDRARAEETDPTRSVTVNGEGRVSLPPDTAYLALGVDIRDPDLGVAQSTAAERMEAIIAALRAAGVAEDDIQTGTYSIYVERDYNQPNQPIIGYHVSHTVTAKVRNLDATGATLAAAIDAGANNVGGIWFGLENPGDAIAQARELAMADAKAKAEDLARLADSTLGPVLTISEGYSTPPQPVEYARADTAQSVAPPINPGSAEVVLTVTVKYTLN